MDTIQIKVRVAKEELYFVDNVLKAYENMAMTTVEGVEGDTGHLNLEVSEGTRDDVLKILHNLQNKVKLEIVEEK